MSGLERKGVIAGCELLLKARWAMVRWLISV
jgi:hypothetical protein